MSLCKKWLRGKRLINLHEFQHKFTSLAVYQAIGMAKQAGLTYSSMLSAAKAESFTEMRDFFVTKS